MRGCNRELRVPEEAPQGVVDLYMACTDEDAAERPTAREVVERLQQLHLPSLVSAGGHQR